VTLAEYTIRQIVRAAAWRALRRAPIWVALAILGMALLLGGCEEAQRNAQQGAEVEVNKRLPAGCAFKYVGEFSYVGRVSFVHCRDRPTTTMLNTYRSGKSSFTSVTVLEEP
jgi:hypothetical protein